MPSRRLLLLVAGGFVLGSALAGGAPAHRDAARADLVVRLVDAPDPTLPADGVGYRVAVTNRGPAPADDVVVRLRTSSLRVISIGVPSGCFADRRSVGCRRFSLLPGRTWRLKFSAAPCSAGTLWAATGASSGTTDPRPRNNVAHARTTILPGPPPPPPPGGSGGCG